MNIFYIYRSPRKQMYLNYLKNLEPSTFLYGLPEIRKLGHNVSFSDIAYSKFNLLQFLLYPLEKIHMWLLNYPVGFKLHQAIILFPLYRKYDVIISTQDSAGLPLLLLKYLGLLKAKVIYITNNISNSLIEIRYLWYRKIIIKLLKSADKIICYSPKEKDILKKFLINNVNFIPFGTDIKFFKPVNKRPTIDIISIGKDIYRDYQTLFKAVSKTDYKVSIVCAKENLNNLILPENVRIFINISHSEIKNLLGQARLVVIPLKKTDKTQGQAVFLEALAMNKKIIISKVPSITSVYDINGLTNIVTVPPENSVKLRNAIYRSMLMKNIKNNRKKTNSLSMETYSHRLLKIIS